MKNAQQPTKTYGAIYVTITKNGKPRFSTFSRGRLWPCSREVAEASFAAGATVFPKRSGVSIWQELPGGVCRMNENPDDHQPVVRDGHCITCTCGWSPAPIRRAEHAIVRALVDAGFGPQSQVTREDRFEIATDEIIVRVKVNPDVGRSADT